MEVKALFFRYYVKPAIVYDMKINSKESSLSDI